MEFRPAYVVTREQAAGEAAARLRQLGALREDDDFPWPPPADALVMQSEEADGSYEVGSRVTVRYPDGQEKSGTVTVND